MCLHYRSIPNFNNEEDAFSSANKNFTINRRPIGNINEDTKNNMSSAQVTRLPSRPRIRLRRTQTAHSLDISTKKSFESKRTQENPVNTSTNSTENKNGMFGSGSGDTKKGLPTTKEPPPNSPMSQSASINLKINLNTSGTAMNNSSNTLKLTNTDSVETRDPTTNNTASKTSIQENKELSDEEKNISNCAPTKLHQLHTSISSVSDLVGNNRFRIGRRASTISRTELRQREAMWDLFQSENAFLIDHLMVIKHVS